MSSSARSSDSESGRLLVGIKGPDVFLAVEGRGTHLISQALREWLWEMTERGLGHFRLDLSSCAYLDSTFLGVLAGACLRLQRMKGDFTLMGASERNLELFRTLGILGFFHVEESVCERPERLFPLTLDVPESRAATVLEAHRTLAELDERNATRFKDVIQCLEEDLARCGARRASSSAEPTRS